MSRSSSMRRTRRRDTEPTRSVLIKAGLTLGVIALFVGLSVTVQEGTPGKDYSKLYIQAAETGSLRANDRVAIGGVRVGRVADIVPAQDRARIELQLEPGVKVSKDTQGRIRANGLLGARLVQLIPGSDRSPIADGATIVAADDAMTSSVPDALDVFNAETRGGLGKTITGLGAGLMGNGERLNDGVRVASDATVPFAAIMREIRLKGEPQELLPSLDSGVSALSSARTDLRRLMGPAADTLDAISATRDDLRATLDEAPSALAAGTAGLDSGTRLLAATNGLARSAHRTLPTAPAGLRAASDLLRTARTPVGSNGSPLERTTKLLKTAEPTVPQVLKVTRALNGVIPRLDGALGELPPILQYVGKYQCDIVNTGITLRSMTGFVGTGEGPNGPSSQFRLQAAAGLEALGVNEFAKKRIAYYEPCTFKGGKYDIPPTTSLGPLFKGGR